MTYYNDVIYTEDIFVEANNRLKKELQSKLNPQYKQYMEDKNEVLLRPYIKKSNINELTPNHIEFIGLCVANMFIKNPYLLNNELDDALDTPVDITERKLIHYLLLNLINIGNYINNDWRRINYGIRRKIKRINN